MRNYFEREDLALTKRGATSHEPISALTYSPTILLIPYCIAVVYTPFLCVNFWPARPRLSLPNITLISFLLVTLFIPLYTHPVYMIIRRHITHGEGWLGGDSPTSFPLPTTASGPSPNQTVLCILFPRLPPIRKSTNSSDIPNGCSSEVIGTFTTKSIV